MRNGFMIIIALLVIFASVSVIIWRFLHNKQKIKHAKLIAHTDEIYQLPEFKQMRLQYHVALGALGIIFVIGYTLTAIVAARPVDVKLEDNEYDARDIMLCLDVSGSMESYVHSILQYYSDASSRLKGQRIGVTIFDSNAVMIMPLTNDYTNVIELIGDMSNNYSQYVYLAQKATGTSLIGEGLISCVNNFDKLGDEERTRSIIMATDNLAYQKASVSLAKAANYARRYDVVVYGLDTWQNSDLNRTTEESTEYRNAVLATGGIYYGVNDKKLEVEAIVQRIMRADATRYHGSIKTLRTDAPDAVIIGLIIATGLLLGLIWRLKL